MHDDSTAIADPNDPVLEVEALFVGSINLEDPAVDSLVRAAEQGDLAAEETLAG